MRAAALADWTSVAEVSTLLAWDQIGAAMSGRWSSVATRTANLAARASECRHLATIAGSDDARAAYLRLAKSYDTLANAAEPARKRVSSPPINESADLST